MMRLLDRIGSGYSPPPRRSAGHFPWLQLFKRKNANDINFGRRAGRSIGLFSRLSSHSQGECPGVA